MSKPRHAAVQSSSRKRSTWIAAIALVVLGLVSAGIVFFSSQNDSPPVNPPTVTATPTPPPTVTPSPEPTPTETPAPTLNENEISLHVWGKGTESASENLLWLKGIVGDDTVLSSFYVEPSLYDLFENDRSYIVTVSYDEPHGVPLIIAVR